MIQEDKNHTKKGKKKKIRKTHSIALGDFDMHRDSIRRSSYPSTLVSIDLGSLGQYIGYIEKDHNVFYISVSLSFERLDLYIFVTLDFQ